MSSRAAGMIVMQLSSIYRRLNDVNQTTVTNHVISWLRLRRRLPWQRRNAVRCEAMRASIGLPASIWNLFNRRRIHRIIYIIIVVVVIYGRLNVMTKIKSSISRTTSVKCRLNRSADMSNKTEKY